MVLVVMDFASHRIWTEGYQRASQSHDVQLIFVLGERWKWRMLTSSIELLFSNTSNGNDNNTTTIGSLSSSQLDDCDILIVDGMLDLTLLVVYINEKRNNNNNRKIINVYAR